MRDLIRQYESTIKRINRRIEKLRQRYSQLEEQYSRNKESVDVDEWNQIKVSLQYLNSMVKDMVYSVCIMEEYLPIEERTRNNKLHENYSRQILNKRNIVGYVPEGGLQVDNPEDLACNVMLQEKLNDVIQLLLSEKQWETLVMYYIYDMNQEEIARELGVGRTTIAMRLKDSIEILRDSELLQEYIDEYSRN